MTDHKHDKKEDRHAVLDDWKRRIVDLMENGQDVPEVDWNAEPLRYYHLNKKWAARVFGWLDWLENEAGWKDAEGQNHIGIQGIMAFEEGIELPDYELDCGDVEDCLSTSDIISNLNEQIDALNEQIDDLKEQVDELEKELEAGGTPLPDNPPMASASDDLCRGAAFISNRLRERMLEYYDMAKTLTWQEFVDAVVNIASIGFTPAVEFWQFAFTIGSPTLATDAAAFTDRIQEAFFCAQWDLTRAKEIIDTDASIPTNEKALWLSVLDLYQQGQIDEWGLVGTLDSTPVDCSEGCPWVVVFNFNGLYVADGSETLIITGDSWTVTGGGYNESQGYVALADVMTISNPLPQQSRLISYHVSASRIPTMAAADLRFWWRGATGTGSEQFSTILRTLNTDFQTFNFSVLGQPLMSQSSISYDAFLPTVGFGQRIGWVKLVGTGSYPES